MKILVVFTGGTIGSAANDEGYFSPNSDRPFMLLEYYDKMFKKDVEFDTASPYTTLSENLNFSHIARLINFIRNVNINDYCGIIVTHGTDTIQYSSSALSYAFSDSAIPIVMVSSNHVLDDPRANGLDNFRAAVEFISNGSDKGVFVAYRNDAAGVIIHRGSRLIAHQPYSDALYSVKNKYYGIFRKTGYERNCHYEEIDDEMEPVMLEHNVLYSSVAMINPYVGIRYPNLDDKTSAVILGSFHSGTLCTDSDDFINFAKETFSRQIPVFVAGAEPGMTYESVKKLKEKKIHILPTASPIAMYIKAVLLEAEGKKLEEDMYKNLGGDIVVPK